jgi:hypothetical protein
LISIGAHSYFWYPVGNINREKTLAAILIQ